MRPPGEIRQALLDAARHLMTPDQAPTVAEMARHAKVAMGDATNTVKNMKRYGALCKVRERRVPYRNRPVFEYAPPDMVDQSAGFVDLAQVFNVWAN